MEDEKKQRRPVRQAIRATASGMMLASSVAAACSASSAPPNATASADRARSRVKQHRINRAKEKQQESARRDRERRDGGAVRGFEDSNIVAQPLILARVALGTRAAPAARDSPTSARRARP